MIAITKGDAPDWLSANSERLTRDYIASCSTASTPGSPWQRVEVAEALRAECSEKCMYCECQPETGSYFEVEHIKPKSQFPALILVWENLGLACSRCNRSKSSYWSEDNDLRLLNPYLDLIREHLTFSGPMLLPKEGSTRAKRTISKLQLNDRTQLLVARMKKIEHFEDTLQAWEKADSSAKRSILYEELLGQLSGSAEFSGCLRDYALSKGFEPVWDLLATNSGDLLAT